MISSHRPPPTAASGGVLWRLEDDRLLVALVHRPRYDDWTLPKGKLDPAEPPLMAAIREVSEETGATVEVGRRLATVEYLIGTASKRVRYWSMRYLAGDHTPSEEVDEIRWLTIADATQLLTYPIDRSVLADFARLPAVTSCVLLIRHAKAGKRSQYHGEDSLRPLDKIGRRQARDAVPFLLAFNPTEVLSADLARCEQTVRPLADRKGLEISRAPEFSDFAYADAPRQTMKALKALGERTGATLVCSQGNAIPGLLADLEAPAADYPSRKGSVWMLSFHRGSVISADYYPHPTV